MARRLGFLLIVVLVAVSGGGVSTAQTDIPSCAGAPVPRLTAGSQGYVTPGLPNVLRNMPSTDKESLIIATIPAGSSFLVLSGPECADGIHWWRINYNGLFGWTPEGSADGEYWTSPALCSALPPRLVPGGQARITPGAANNLRSEPGTGEILTTIPGGATVSVIAGPQCSSDRNYWQVNYSGTIGWTGEGEGETYWMEPLVSATPNPTPDASTCEAAPLPQLVIGTTGYAPLGASVPLHMQPLGTSEFAGSIPGGATFLTAAGPVCVDDAYWWRVEYNGITGWLLEGQNDEYNVEPFVCEGFLPSRLVIGGQGSVAPGLAAALRETASTSAAAVGQMASGDSFSVLSGPQCGESTAWWRVDYNGLVGWTMEGQGTTYFLLPE